MGLLHAPLAASRALQAVPVAGLLLACAGYSLLWGNKRRGEGQSSGCCGQTKLIKARDLCMPLGCEGAHEETGHGQLLPGTKRLLEDHCTVQSVCSPHLQPCRQDRGEKGFRGVLLAAGLAGVCSGMGSEDLVCCWIGLLISPRRQILVSTLTTTLP